jgi:hypothetical protein
MNEFTKNAKAAKSLERRDGVCKSHPSSEVHLSARRQKGPTTDDHR